MRARLVYCLLDSSNIIQSPSLMARINVLEILGNRENQSVQKSIDNITDKGLLYLPPPSNTGVVNDRLGSITPDLCRSRKRSECLIL